VTRVRDITFGLPRVAELFEARRPKDACIIAKIEGIVSFGGNVRGKKLVVITHTETGEQVDHLVPMNKRVVVSEDDIVKRGDQITEGPVSPEELLEACGAQALQSYLLNEVQSVYRVQGVEINDKHIEIIIRQMLRKVQIIDPGDANQYLWGDQVDRSILKRMNAEIIANGGKPAESEPILLGITKASLETDSFISAASFQDTTRVLTEAATLGRVDHLTGFKENVIVGQLIPAGTGFHHYRKAEFEFTVEEPEPVIAGRESFEDDEDYEQKSIPLPMIEPTWSDIPVQRKVTQTSHGDIAIPRFTVVLPTPAAVFVKVPLEEAIERLISQGDSLGPKLRQLLIRERLQGKNLVDNRPPLHSAGASVLLDDEDFDQI
jgi:DNA-directed RNA polymerase subunit beta'